MTLGDDFCVSRLNREWAWLRGEPVPTSWAIGAGRSSTDAKGAATLEAVLGMVAADPDAVLGSLLLLQAQGDEKAGRVVLQAMLGKLVLMARRDHSHSVGDYITECWLQLCQYPLARRPRRIAANLALDTRRAVWACSTKRPVSLDPLSFDELPQPPATSTIDVIRAATRLGLIDRSAGACLVAVYCLGLRSHEAAQQLAISPELVRWRNARSIRRLAPHAVALAAAA